MTRTSDRPPLADVDTLAGLAAVNAGSDASELGQASASPGKPPAGGRRNGRKRRRKRGRRPVYAPGTGPQNGGSPAAVTPAPSPQSPDIRVATVPVDAARAARPDAPVYAALDLGTNNCRLLLASPRDYGFRVVDAFSRIVRLGEGVGSSGRLTEAAMDRAIDALRICGGKIAERKVTRARLIATEACRAAANGAEFVARVEAETGLTLEIVSQETEARLAVAGCASLVDPQADGVILFDIGGGSSELVWIDLAPDPNGRRRRMADRIRTWTSLPVGVVNVSERHGGRQVTRAIFEAMVEEVAAMLAAFPQAAALDRAVSAGDIHMLGTSGTVTTLAGVHLRLPRYDRRRVDGTWLSHLQVGELVETLLAMDYEARVANPCIGRERADLVLAGCAILEAIRRRWPCQRLRVADRGLREGILVELMAEDGVWRSRSARRAGETADA